MKSDWQPPTGTSTGTPTWTDTCLIISFLCIFSILCVLYPHNIYLSFIFCIYNFMHLFFLYLYILNTGQWLALLAQSRKIVASEIAACWGDFVWSLHVLPWLVFERDCECCLPLCVSLAVDWQPVQSVPRLWPCDGMDWPLVLCDPKRNKWKKWMELCILQLFQANFCLIWSSVLKYEIITFASHSLHSNCLLLFPSDLQADKIK